MAVLQPGDPITTPSWCATELPSSDVHIWDVLPDGVIGEDVDITVTIAADTSYTITIPAALAADVAFGSTIVNTAYYESGELTGNASASFSVVTLNKLFLPLVMKY
jgi:hypothetical protein